MTDENKIVHAVEPVEFSLLKPIVYGGITYKDLILDEPEYGVLIALGKIPGADDDDEANELRGHTLLAGVMGIPIEALMKVKPSDLVRVQEAAEPIIEKTDALMGKMTAED